MPGPPWDSIFSLPARPGPRGPVCCIDKQLRHGVKWLLKTTRQWIQEAEALGAELGQPRDHRKLVLSKTLSSLKCCSRPQEPKEANQHRCPQETHAASQRVQGEEEKGVTQALSTPQDDPAQPMSPSREGTTQHPWMWFLDWRQLVVAGAPGVIAHGLNGLPGFQAHGHGCVGGS